MAHDVGAHARDELGISEITKSRPLQAAGASALSFATGAALPLVIVALIPASILAPTIAGAALLTLAALGGLAAKVGGAKVRPEVLRVTFWSALALALAMAVAYGIGAAFGTAVGG